MTRSFVFCLSWLCLFAVPGCFSEKESTDRKVPASDDAKPLAVVDVDPQLVKIIEDAFGAIDRDADGNIVAVNLAQARSSVDDKVLSAALAIPGLKKLRVAGSAISKEALEKIAEQTQLQELFLQDTVIHDESLAAILSKLSELKRLTLRRCINITDDAAELFLAKTNLRNLALIEMNIGCRTIETIGHSRTVTALDLRDCSRLAPEDYALITKMRQLTDLKIGGFNVNDHVLETVSQLPHLTGLTIEDAMISPEAFARMLETAAWKNSLIQLVLSRDAMLFDDGLLSIRNLPKLKRLTVCGMMVTGTFLEKTAQNENDRLKLETLSLRMSLLTPEGAAALQKYRELKSLDLSGVAMTGELAEIIATLGTLESLNLSGCRLTDETVGPIRKMTSLQSLNLDDNPIFENR